jgi:hypothetical protein
MGGGATSPLLRVVPETGAIIDGVLIAPGVSPSPCLFREYTDTLTILQLQTVVGSSSHFVHRNGDIFHDPDEYIPERWMDGRGDELEQHLVAFGRGPRRCIGEKLVFRLF